MSRNNLQTDDLTQLPSASQGVHGCAGDSVFFSREEGDNAVAGFIKLSREFYQGPEWGERRVFSKAEAFIDLVYRANWSRSTMQRRNNAIVVERGQLVVALDTLGKAWDWHKMKVKRFIEKCDGLRYETVTNLGRITIVNYDCYVEPCDGVCDESVTESVTIRRSKEAINKNSCPDVAAVVVPTASRKDLPASLVDVFDEFWTAYPRKEGKGAARKAFAKAIANGATATDIIAGLKTSPAMAREKQYIPHASTWINRESWLDEPDKGSKSTGAPVVQF